jgi:hypothetical protein
MLSANKGHKKYYPNYPSLSTANGPSYKGYNSLPGWKSGYFLEILLVSRVFKAQSYYLLMEERLY